MAQIKAIGSQITVDTAASIQSFYYPEVAMTDDGSFVVAWQWTGGESGVNFVGFNLLGEQQYFKQEFTDSFDTEINIASLAIDADGDFVLAFLNGENILTQLYSETGEIQGSDNFISCASVTVPAVAYRSDWN